jgi:hypothetical protein
MEAPSLVLPLVYDVSTNITQLAEKRDPGPASATTAASLQLKRFAEFGVSHNECSLFPAVRDLLCTLSLPSESQAQVREVSLVRFSQYLMSNFGGCMCCSLLLWCDGEAGREAGSC